MYDIKSFAIAAFLTSLLLKEQMMISGKKRKNLVRDNTKPLNEIAKQAGLLSTKNRRF